MLPIVSRSVPVTGNRNKLTIALALVRSLAPVMMNKPVRLLFYAWFMRARLVFAAAVAKDADHRSSTVRYRIIPAIRQCVQAWTRTTQNLRDQNDAGARGMVRILRCRQTALVKSTFAVGDRNGFACRGDTASVCAPLGHRTLVSQLEAAFGV